MSFLDLKKKIETNNKGLLYPGNVETLKYPSDLFQPGTSAFVNFRVKSSMESDTSTYSNMWLNMPSTLTVNYGADWENVETPISKLIEVGEASGSSSIYKPVVDSMSDFIAGQGIDIAKLAGGVWDAAKDGVMGLSPGSVMKNQGVHYGAINYIKNKFNASYAYEYRKRLGGQMGAKNLATVNPFVSQVYQSPKFRLFNMGFQFFARNEEDAKSIKKIINTLKSAMHPGILSTGQLFWDAPYVFEATFYTTPQDTKMMFNIKKAALTDLSVNYAGSQVPAFFKDGHPVEIDVTAQFKEISLLTREDVESGGRNGGRGRRGARHECRAACGGGRRGCGGAVDGKRRAANLQLPDLARAGERQAGRQRQ